MKPLRLALYIILLIFHAILVILSLNFSESIAEGIARNPSAFRFYAFFGLAVLLVTFAFAWFDRRTARKRIERLEGEKNAIKAEIYDREQRVKEREREIEGEIQSFQQSLPAAEPVVKDFRADTIEYTGSDVAESDTIPPKTIQSAPIEPEANDDDPVEYAPLKPKPDSFLATPDPDEPDADETDPNPFRP